MGQFKSFWTIVYVLLHIALGTFAFVSIVLLPFLLRLVCPSLSLSLISSLPPCFLHFVRQQNLRRRQLAASKAFDEYYNPMRITIRPEKKGRNVDIRLDKNLTSLCSAVLTAFLFAQIRLFHG